MSPLSILAMAAVTLSHGVATTTLASGQLLRPGKFMEEYLASVPTEGSWQALCPTVDGFAIRTTLVTIRPAEPIELGDGPVAMKDVHATRCPKALVLMRVGPLHEGDVDTVFSGRRDVGRDTDHELQLGASRSTLLARDPEPDTREIILRSGGVEQTIAVVRGCCNDAQPMLLWAGDLDGDGKLDLVMDLTMHYAHSEYALFLSSRASDGELLKDVAHFVSGSC